MKPIILHISNDYPDPIVPRKTKAVQSLVDGTPQYRHIVYSLNRASAWNGLCAIPFGEDRTAVSYGALPKGIGWGVRLNDVARWLISDLKSRGIQPQVIEAHKFTIEGIIGLQVAKAFSCPLVCDIQGYTDVNMLTKKPAFLPIYREIAEGCAAVFPYAPWPLDIFNEKTGLSKDKIRQLPVIPTIDTMVPAPVIEENRVLSVFHLDGWKNKNFIGMAQALKFLNATGLRVMLDVYGAGSPKTMLILQTAIEKYGLQGQMVLKGPVENARMTETMQKYAGFVMPSHSESYGLVYVESLFSGVPIVLNANRGISGYFDLSEVGYGCDPSRSDDIAKGIRIIIEKQRDLKENIAKMQKRGMFDFMRRHNILKTYSRVLDDLLVKR